MSNNIAYFKGDELEIELPPFRGLEALRIPISATKIADSRMHEAKIVNASSYAELEHIFNEAYRELKKNIANVGYRIVKLQNEYDKVKASLMLDRYPDFIKEKGVKFDSATMREAFLANDKELMEIKENIDFLEATKTFLEGRVRVLENVCQYMRNTIRMITRSGVNSDIYYKK